MRSERQALADIAKLREPGPDGVLRWRVGHVGRKLDAILADVEPEPAPAGGTIDRGTLDAKDHGIDCSSIEWAYGSTEGDSGLPCDCWKSLVRPVEGVVLTREEAAVAYDVVQAFRGVQGGRLSDTGFGLRVEALAERLEAAS